MTDIIKDPNDICGWLDNLANLKADELNHPATLDGLREIGRDAKLEIERLREALREYTCDCENGCQGIRGEVCGDKARAALGEKE